MILEWLRRHKKSVYKPLAVVVVITFTFLWGSSRSMSRQHYTGGMRISIGGKTITEQEFDRFSNAYMMLVGRRVPDQYTFRMLVDREIDRQVGVAVAPAAVEKAITSILKQRLAVEKVDDTSYTTYLRQYGMTGPDFEAMVAEQMASQELSGTIQTAALFSDDELFIAYRRDKQELTYRYKDFPVKDSMAGVAEPTEEELKSYHSTFSVLPEGDKDALVNPSQYRLVYLLADESAFEKKVKVTEDDLKKEYEQVKEWRYAVEKPAEGAPAFKLFEEVKAEVEKDFVKAHGRTMARDALAEARKELGEGLGKLAKENPEAKEAPEQKILDLFDSAAKKNDLVVGTVDWTTKAGLKSVAGLGDASGLETYLAQATRTWSNLVPDVRTEKGTIAVVVLSHKASTPMEYEAAKPEIIKKIKWSRAEMAANNAAMQLINSIVAGEKLDMLDKEYTEAGNKVESSQRFLSVGKVGIDPVKFNDGKDDESYRVVLLKSRELPVMTDYEKDTMFARITKAQTARNRAGYFAGAWWQYWATKLDPKEISPRRPVTEEDRRSQEEDY